MAYASYAQNSVKHYICFGECSHVQAIWESIFPVLDKVGINTLNNEIEKPQICCLLGIHYKPPVC